MNTNANLKIPQPIELSCDGYIRVTKKILKTISFKHLDSGLYEDHPKQTYCNDRQSDMAGYTEWISETAPLISIGWDWKLDCIKQPIMYSMTGFPYSNLIVQDNNFMDLDQHESLDYLSKIVNNLNWQGQLLTLITDKYS